MQSIENIESIENNVYSMFSGLKLNSTKCEVAGIGVLKVAQEAVCGKRGIKLNTETVRMLGIHGN